MRPLMVWALLVFLSACGGGGGGGSTPGPGVSDGPSLETIEVSPHVSSMALGTTLTFTATGIYSDKTAVDISDAVSWAVDDDSVLEKAAVLGQIHAVGQGQATVRASLEGVEARMLLSVTPATVDQLTLLPAGVTLAAGTREHLSALAVFSDETRQDITDDISWVVDDPAVAALDEHWVQGLTLGQTQIHGSFGGHTESVTITVTAALLQRLELSPSQVSLAAGVQTECRVTGVFSDQSKKDVTADAGFQSTNENVTRVRPVMEAAVLESYMQGSATITATVDGLSATAAVTVTPARLERIDIGPVQETLALGLTRQMTATGLYTDGSRRDVTATVLWASSDEDVAVVSNAEGSKGFLNALVQGTVNITASVGNNTGTAVLTVGEAQLQALTLSAGFQTLPLGLTRPITAHGLYTDNGIRDVTDDVIWRTSDTSLAVIDNGLNKGALTGVSLGSVTVTASLDGVDESLFMTIDDASLTAIEISPEAGLVAAGQSLSFTATGLFSDQTTAVVTEEVLWTSSDPAVVLAGNDQGNSGVFLALAPGDFTVTAQRDGISASVTARVSDAVLTDLFISPADLSLEQGMSASLQATGLYSDGSVRDVTDDVLWTSSHSAVAHVANGEEDAGVVLGLAQGSADISAAFSGLSAVCAVTVTDVGLASLSVSASADSLALGTELQLQAQGTFNDTSERDLTGTVLWVSSDPAIATIGTGVGEAGVLRGIAQGQVDITAYYGGESDTLTVTVTDAVLVSLTVLPADQSLPSGLNLQYQALGHFSDASTQDLTDRVLWSVDNKARATISNLSGLNGLLYALAPGAVSVTASLGGISESTGLTVTGETLVGVRMIPELAVVREGSDLALVFEALFSDDSAIDLTADVVWLAVDPAIATVSNAEGLEGRVTGVGTGGAYVLAVFGQLGFVKPVFVISDFHMAFQEVEPGVLQFVAYGDYGDGETVNMTEYVTWTSSDETVLTISNEAGEQGRAQVLQQGTVSITARYNDDVTATGVLTIN